MGLLSSIKSIGGSLVQKSQSIVKAISSPVAIAAAKVDSFVPHPAGGGFENVVRTLSTPFTGGRVTANVKNPTIKRALELVSNNPLATAGIAAGGVTATRAIAGSVAKSGATSAARSAVARAAPTAKAAGMIKPAVGGGVIAPQSSTAPITMTGSPQTAQGGILKTTSSAPASRSSSRPRRKRKAASTARKKSRRRKATTSKKKKFGTAKQFSRPGGKTPHYSSKLKRWYVILPGGKWRIVKGKRK